MPNIISTMRNSRYQTRRSAKQMEFEQKQAISRDGRGPKPVWSDITGAEFLPPGFEYFVSQAPAPASAQAQSTAVLIPESSIFQPAVTAAASMSADAAESLAIRLENFDSFSITTDHRSSSPESFTLVGSGATTPEQYYYSAAAYPTFIAPQHQTFSTARTVGSAAEENDLESLSTTPPITRPRPTFSTTMADVYGAESFQPQPAVVQSIGYNADGSFTSFGSYGAVRW